MVVRHIIYLPGYFFKRDGTGFISFHGHHNTKLFILDELDSFCPQAGGKEAVGCRGCPSALQMAEFV